MVPAENFSRPPAGKHAVAVIQHRKKISRVVIQLGLTV
jgi:hypothetical protein